MFALCVFQLLCLLRFILYHSVMDMTSFWTYAIPPSERLASVSKPHLLQLIVHCFLRKFFSIVFVFALRFREPLKASIPWFYLQNTLVTDMLIRLHHEREDHIGTSHALNCNWTLYLKDIYDPFISDRPFPASILPESFVCFLCRDETPFLWWDEARSAS